MPVEQIESIHPEHTERSTDDGTETTSAELEDLIENTLGEFKRYNVLGKLRALVKESRTFFTPETGYVVEGDESPTGAVLDTYQEAILGAEPGDIALAGLSTDREKNAMLTAVAPGSMERQILLAYWGVNETTSWEQTSNDIITRQAHQSPDFPSVRDVLTIESRVNQ